MNGVEDLWQFDPNRRQIVYVEKTAVIDLFGRNAPRRQPIRLRVEQFIQDVEAARVAGLSVDLCQGFVDRLLHLRRFGTKSLQASLDDLFFSNALCDPFWISFGALRQVFERGQNALQFRIKILVLVSGEIF